MNGVALESDAAGWYDPGMETHEVVIVGAGSAGLATGGLLRREGLVPLLLEAGPEPGAAWRERYDRAVSSGALEGFAGCFHDLWRYYLMYCEGGFRGGAIDVAQVTLSKVG